MLSTPSPIRRATRLAASFGAAGLLLLASLPLFGQALDASLQGWPAQLDADTRVLPVWSNASGRVEALLLLDPIEPALSTNALDRVLSRRASGFGVAGRASLDDGARLRTSLQLDSDAGLALLCDGRSGVAQSLGSLGDHCLLATLAHDDPLLAAAGRGARLGGGWLSPDERVDLSFGLSWLQLRPEPTALWNPPGGNVFADALGAIDTLGTWAQRLDSRSLRIDSLINLGPQTRMLLGGDVGRSRLLRGDGSIMQIETAALTFGLGMGDFSGQLTGRLIELPRSGNHWSTLDIGVSWRTPWRGELSLGARNVLGASDPSRWPLAELPAAIEDPSARVPYVRYQQDL